MTPLLVALGASLGAPSRFWLGERLDTQRFPWGILAANVSGSLALGLFVGLGVEGRAYALLGTGFCGGFTTYSSFAVRAHSLGRRAGTAYVLLTTAAALAACALGFAIGQA